MSPSDPVELARDRARGALVGLAAGDAVGTTVEFRRPGSFEPLTHMVGGGPFGLRPGQWTDDTSMALCLAESIVDRRSLDLADHHRRYLAWRDDGYLSSTGRCFDIGATVNGQLRRFQRTGEPVDPRPDEQSAANGSLMRLAPVPIAWHREVSVAVERSGESSRSTHAAGRPVDACRLMGAMVAALVDGRSAGEVLAPGFWRWGDLHPEVRAIADGSFLGKEPPEIRGTGFCIDALEAALWAVVGATDFRDAVLRAANLGDDADTTAAIAGQLAGARWGMSGIPSPWRFRLKSHERLVSLADALFDMEVDAQPPSRWAHDDQLHGWWVRPGQVLAGEYPGSPTGQTHKIEVLLDAGIRTFVDLTTGADGLVSYHDALTASAAFRRLGVRHLSRPIPDLGVVAFDELRAIVAMIDDEVAAGRPVFVHCWGGVGRTGTVAACLLAAEGSGDTGVLDRLAAVRAGTRKADRPCPDTDEQRALVTRWCGSGA